MTETALREVERFKVGFANDWTGALHKYLIVDRTLSGRYVVKRFSVLFDRERGRFLASTPIEIKDKSEITGIHYETLEGEII